MCLSRPVIKLHNYIFPLLLSSLKSKLFNKFTYAYLLLISKPKFMNSMKIGNTSLQNLHKVHLT